MGGRKHRTKSAGRFLRDVLKRLRGGEGLKLGLRPENDNLTLVHRRRAEWSKQLLENPVFQDAIQFMNEQIVQDIASTDPLDTKRLRVLRLRLEVVSEFPQVLWQFVDEYQTILAIKAQYEQQSEEYDREVA